MKRWKKIIMWIVRTLGCLAMTRKTLTNGRGGAARMRTVMENAVTTASGLASVSFGPNSSRLLPRSQVYFSLRADCKASTRKIDLLVLHCSDTKPSQDFTLEKLLNCHQARGFGPWPGYHIYIRRDGTMYYCRPVCRMGCHAAGFNANSIAICYEGGHRENPSPNHKYEDNRTAEQMVVLHEVLIVLHECYPQAKIVGHNELPGVAKACPCLERPASEEYGYIRDIKGL